MSHLEKSQELESKFMALCSELRQAATSIMESKRVSEATNTSLPDNLKVQSNKGAIILTDLKQVNRDIHMLVDEAEKAVQNDKAAVDEQTLTLHNFVYEQQQFITTIRCCQQFKSRHTLVPLVDLETYFNAHPEDRQLEQSNPHKLMLNRLNWELQERVKLEEVAQNLRQQKAALHSKTESAQKFLDGLKDVLKGVKDSTKPLQDYMKTQTRERNKENKKASLLPTPLYILFHKLSAYAAHYTDMSPEGTFEADGITVRINGRRSAVDSFCKQLSKQLNPETTEENTFEPSAKRRKQSSTPASPTESLSVEDTAVISSHDCHPLHIECSFTVKDEDVDANLTLKFYFVPLMNHIAVEVSVPIKSKSESKTVASCLGDARVLTNLFPNDDGKNPPNPRSSYTPGNENTTPSPSHRLPFKWAQWLGGFDFMFPLDQMPESQVDLCKPVSEIFNCRSRIGVAKVCEAVRDRIQTRLCLGKQLDWLKKKQFGSIKLSSDPGKWQTLEPVKFISFEESAAEGSAEENKWPREYKAEFQNDKYVFKATITIYEDYPATPSVVCLSQAGGPSNSQIQPIPEKLIAKADARALELVRQSTDEPVNNLLKIIEAEVNYNLKSHFEAPANKDKHLLTRQLLLLMRCLDIYIHVESGHTERLCLRAHRGRHRSLPFRWNSTLNVFEH